MMDEQELKYSWSIRLDHKFNEKLVPFQMPRLRQALAFIPLTLRYFKYYLECKCKSQAPIIDILNPLKCKQIYGCPIGGIGCGTIGRSFSGDFCRYQLVPGIYEHECVEANLFTVCVRRKGVTVYQQTLSTRRPLAQKGLKSWNMSYSGEYATYYALYPESWTIYDLPGQNIRLICHQLTPIIPHNYKDSSLPCALFEWTIENNSNEDVDVSLMFTWQCGSASERFKCVNLSSESFENGILMKQRLNDMNLDYVLEAESRQNQEISYCSKFYPNNEQSGSQLWFDLIDDGKLDNNEHSFENINDKIACALCVKTKINSQQNDKIILSLVWNMPQIKFPKGSKVYNRFYTRYFGNHDKTALNISKYSLESLDKWKQAIRKWREDIFNNETTPTTYKQALFNELYYLSDGGTIWIDVKDDLSLSERIREYGRFAYLEGHEYKMYNTYDVHFYASFALLMLYPQLQLSLQYDYSSTVPLEYDPKITYLLDGKFSSSKSPNCVPHDLGNPEYDPWIRINAYNVHDTHDWIDLNLKFILQVYRDYNYLKDKAYLKDMWPSIKILLDTIETQDRDGDCLIDSLGKPDQTYDAWSVSGASAYCGGLHLATLKCSIEMCRLLDDNQLEVKLSGLLERAEKSYHDKLWNGIYFNYDSSKNNYHDSIMTDMCCGHWFLRSSGFKYELFDRDKILNCIKKIYDLNVIKFGNCKFGAVNGMRPNGKVDTTSIQSEEMWIGTTCALVSLMIFEDEQDKAWQIVNGLYDTLYNRLGLAFQTPEALFKDNTYRSLGYMRALCIWSIQYAIELNRK
jgi:non-lysosomal glucosylceramidase